MELGNMMFGNSRGEYPIERSRAFEGPWEELCEELKINCRGYAEDGCLVPERDGLYGVENDTFLIRCYDWDAECDCGAEEKMDAWHERNVHGADCYQTELRSRLKAWEDASGYTAANERAFGNNDGGPFGGMNVEVENPAPGVTTMFATPRTDAVMAEWRALSDRRHKVEGKLYDELCQRHGLDRKYGCAVHCTCGRDDRAEVAWTMIGGHKDGCRLTLPNFLFKPTGLRVNWYKYPFRDAYMSEALKPKQWREIIRQCIASGAVNCRTPPAAEVHKHKASLPQPSAEGE